MSRVCVVGISPLLWCGECISCRLLPEALTECSSCLPLENQEV